MNIGIDKRVRRLILGMVVATGSMATLAAAQATNAAAAQSPAKASGAGLLIRSSDQFVPGKKRQAVPAQRPVAPGESREAEAFEPGRNTGRAADADQKGGDAIVDQVRPTPFPLTAEQLKADKKIVATDFRQRRPDSAELDRLTAKAASGSVRIIVTLKTLFTPEGLLGERLANEQHASIAHLQSRVLDDLKPQLKSGAAVLLRQFEVVPMLALRLNAEALATLAAHVDVAAIQEDIPEPPALNASAPAMGSADALNRGYGGSGWNVAVLDTGIDRGHQFLRGFQAEACFSGEQNSFPSGVVSNCPNGQKAQTGAGAAEACTFAPGACSHGTHVAGIATGASLSGLTNREGAARSALLIPIQVFSRFNNAADCVSAGGAPCALSYPSDQIAGLQHVFNQRFNRAIASANISIGGGGTTVNCDGDARKPIIDSLRSVNIATVISAGNDSFINGVGFPACISSAITVGAIDNDGNVAGFSNIGNANLVDLVAPGVDVVSSCPYSFSASGFCSKSGTSMAAPHVAGAFAVLQQRFPNSTVNSLEFNLEAFGLTSRDQRGGGIEQNLRRVDVLDAARLNEVVLTPDAGELIYRTPRPIRHSFSYVANRSYWSVAAIRQTTGIDVDLRQYNGAGNNVIDFTTPNASSLLGLGSNVTDLIATDHNSGRRSIPDTLGLRSNQFSSSTFAAPDDGYYGVQVSDPGQILGGSATFSFGDRDIVRVYDKLVTAGARQYLRAVHGLGIQIYAFTSDPGNAGSWAKGAAQADASAINVDGGATELSFLPPFSQYAGIAVISRGGSHGVTLYADDSGPAGSVAINGGAATTDSRDVTLAIAASDPQTGIDDMRISVDGGASFGAYQPFSTSAMVTLPDGAGVKTVVVEVRNQAHAPSQFTDTIELSAPAALPVLSIEDVAVTEGNSGTVNATFVFNLSEPSTDTVSVRFATADNTATAGSDYVARSGTVSFTPGQTRKTTNIVVNGDTLFERDFELFFVNLSNPVGLTIGDGQQGVGTIIDDDTAPLPTVGINDVTVTEGNSGTRNATFTFTLSSASTDTVSVRYATANGSATAGSDYVAGSGIKTFNPGQTSQTVTIVVNGDTASEPDETFLVNLSSPVGLSIADGQGLGTIVNDDTATGTPGIRTNVTSFNFGSVRVGQSSAQRMLVITNTGTAPLQITSIRLAGDYTGTSGCSAPVAPGGTCTLTGSFRPTATGPRPGSVTITSNAPTSPTVVTLSGTGT